MHSNNEIGTIQPIEQISEKIKQYNTKHGTNILFHTGFSITNTELISCI